MTMFHKLQGVYPIGDFVLGCKFRNGAVKLYDIQPLMREIPAFAYFNEHPDAFRRVTVSPGGYGIIWRDELDLDAEEIWENGWPEWDENNLVTVEIEIDSELLKRTAECLKPYGLLPEDWMVMYLEALVYPPTQDKMINLLQVHREEQCITEGDENT